LRAQERKKNFAWAAIGLKSAGGRLFSWNICRYFLLLHLYTGRAGFERRKKYSA
jgi:hypothetical protein